MKAPIHGAMALLSALPLGWAPAVLAQATGDVSTGTPAVLTDLDRVFAEVRIGVGGVAPASTVKVTPTEVAAVSVSPLTTHDRRGLLTPDHESPCFACQNAGWEATAERSLNEWWLFPAA
jgi:hypothetical protein